MAQWRGAEHEFQQGSSADAIALIAANLENVVNQNHDLRQSQPTSFDAVSAPSITVHRYLLRIRQYTKFQDECYVVALVYLDRLFAQHKAPYLPTAHNVHRLIITSVLIASKFYDDVFHSNSFMAQVGGISVAEMNKLEIELCVRLNWELHIVHDEYVRMLECIYQPQHALWKRWQHQHALSFSSDEETVVAVGGHALPITPTPTPAAASKSILPLWAGGFLSREPGSGGGGLRRADGPSAAPSGTSPHASVSVR
ncbi:cyclin-domain-containing protein [Pavlovales sp. CCMP2436]|nr:cyclin-domain-containing protein [Pavlovales sp. CCMP2436]|mmetsp:Transcript_15144/g.38431  ORF Transcript_15144/g.38431 Transcript_15144/m.38431 type:complete len:255 (-) Transcript_15144:572-1336(-)